MHRGRADAQAGPALRRGTYARGVHEQDMLQVLGGMRPMGGDGGTTRQTDSGTAAVPNRELQASDQPRSKRSDQHWDQLQAALRGPRDHTGAERGRAAATPLAERVQRFIKWAQGSQGW